MPPCSSTATRYIACTDGSSATSTCTAKLWPMLSATRAAASWSTSATTTCAPSSVNTRPASAPMPRPAPVTSQPFPASRPPSATLEHPRALVAGDDLVEEALLRARVVEVVVDDLVAEEPARDVATLELADRVTERVREA